MEKSQEEFNLKGRIQKEVLGYDRLDVISVYNVKEFIKLLKEKKFMIIFSNDDFSKKQIGECEAIIKTFLNDFYKEIDKLSGGL